MIEIENTSSKFLLFLINMTLIVNTFLIAKYVCFIVFGSKNKTINCC